MILECFFGLLGLAMVLYCLGRIVYMAVSYYAPSLVYSAEKVAKIKLKQRAREIVRQQMRARIENEHEYVVDAILFYKYGTVPKDAVNAVMEELRSKEPNEEVNFASS